jgi:hypothetical protein
VFLFFFLWKIFFLSSGYVNFVEDLFFVLFQLLVCDICVKLGFGESFEFDFGVVLI